MLLLQHVLNVFYLIHSNWLPIKFYHIQYLYGIVCIFFTEKFYKSISLMVTCNSILKMEEQKGCKIKRFNWSRAVLSKYLAAITVIFFFFLRLIQCVIDLYLPKLHIQSGMRYKRMEFYLKNESGYYVYFGTKPES